MEQLCAQITVFFQDPFWVGVWERREGNRLEVCKITFGAEPRDYEVYDHLLRRYQTLRFSPPVEAGALPAATANPKRMQRIIRRQLEGAPVGTKAQQALKLQQQEGKQARKAKSRRQREEEARRAFSIRQQKRKEKHRGH